MRRPRQLIAALLLLVSIIVLRESVELEFWNELGPGAGFFPFRLAIVLAVLAVIMFYQATFGPPEPLPPDFYAPRSGYIRMGAILIAFIWAIVLMNPLGFRPTVFAFLLFLLIALGRQNPVVTGLVSVVGSFGVYHGMVEWLKVPLPVGMFGL